MMMSLLRKMQSHLIPYNNEQLEQLVGKPVRYKPTGGVCLVEIASRGKLGVSLFPFPVTATCLLKDFEYLDGSPCAVAMDEPNRDYI